MNELVSGALAGAVGTAALELIEPLEHAFIGGEPPFAPRVLARRLLDITGLRDDAATATIVGNLLRWSYGPSLGVAYALARRAKTRQRGSEARSSLLLAGAILGFELVVLPALVGRKKVLRPRVLGGLALHVATFAVVAVGIDGLLRR